MTVLTGQRDRIATRRRIAKIDSYADLTMDSDEEIVPLKSSRQVNKRKRTVTPSESDSSENGSLPELGEEEYEIDYIVDSRFQSYGGKLTLEYLVHWKGYGLQDRTWTLGNQFEDDDPPVREFYKRNPKKPRIGQPTVFDLMMRGSKRTALKTSPPKTRISRSKSVLPTVMNKQSGIQQRRLSIQEKISVVEKTASNTKGSVSTKARRNTEDEDFVDDASNNEDLRMDSDLESTASTEDYDEPDDEPKERSSRAASGWKKPKAIKKAPVNLGNYRPKVKPLQLKGAIKLAVKNLSEDLPPINDIEAMFAHLTSRMPDVVDIVKHLNGRKLRVATMCSGTESPLLALNMISKAIKAQHGVDLSFDHVFSCEIEPFKQAYIERNFSPPILFRDVTELGRKEAHTAYGSLVDVPGNVDILIAGTSCVDYSGLNNEKQGIDANGESGRTFRGMLQWVKKHQPPIVILENVCSAPWDKVVEYFAEIDYDAQFQRLDTKEYYIPHTRTRVYLFATPARNGRSENLSEKWAMTVRELRRPWSSPFEAFLLPTDDVNIHRARLDLAAAKFHKDGTQRKATDWGRCESRHARARQEEELGKSRPLTSWQEAGVCKGLDWTWNDWLSAQTERVVDLLEISTLRMAKDGVDAGFKACIWNVSQNVDRQTGSARTALAPCLTPNMIPWVTNRGGPVTGREALALQGIPVRDLLLTSESEDQLADLAGNAMTTTVVGASMLAALQVAAAKLPKGENSEADALAAHDAEFKATESAASRIVGENYLTSGVLNLAKVESANLVDILDLAERSSRHCQCEGQSGTADAPIHQCLACGYRSCKSCGGRPDHVYEACSDKRVTPTEFEQLFKKLLPMRVKIAGLDTASLKTVRDALQNSGRGLVKTSDWDIWSQAVITTVDDAEFRFRYLKRQTQWTAVYEAPNATLDLCLQKSLPEWRLTIKAPSDEPVNSRIRELLLHPVARLRVDLGGHDVLCGNWELFVPSRQSVPIKINGCGEIVPSWQASLGLRGDYEGTRRWSQWEIIVPPETERALDRNISGTYTLLPKCGQAMSSLHIKESAEVGQPPLFFFLDPTRCGDATEDNYVFSTSIERLDYGTTRDTIAFLDSKWRESQKSKDTVPLIICGAWAVCKEAHMIAVGGDRIVVDDGADSDSATYSVLPSPDACIPLTNECSHAVAVLSVKVPLNPSHSESMWKKDSWGEIDLSHHGNETFANLAWITERLPLLDSLSTWNQLLETDVHGTSCPRCAPRPPSIHWIKQAGKLNKNGGKTKGTIVAFEDRFEAGRYEHALKNRPAPFVVQLRLDNGVGSLRIGLNIASLAHRALSRLPQCDGKRRIQLSWRLTPGQVTEVPEPPRVFVIPSNRCDPQNGQPRGFLLSLRKEQLRSLWWMLQQEKAENKTYTFIEEEISEAMLPSLGWRAEGKAERPVMVRGGVIADQVGYGKTIISLALVAETLGDSVPDPEPVGLIDLKATLIIVPGHLSKQWPSEIARFTGDMFRTVVIQNMKDLRDRSINDLCKADIIVMASEIFESDAYWQRFEYLSAQPDDWLNDKQGGRLFSDRLNAAMATLSVQVESLKRDGADAAQLLMDKQHRQAHEEVENKKTELKAANFGKRLKGAAYRDKYDVDRPVDKKFKTGMESWEPADNSDDLTDMSIPRPTFRQASGSESLGSSAVRRNFRLLTCPIIQMFRFRRVIADEFTYLEKKSLAGILHLSSSYKWVLSGTPPVNDFPAIRSIAAFMGLHLGIEDDAEGNVQAQKARAKEQTAAEKFHAFREVHSASWHRRRDQHAQDFLNVFVRQNIAEIEEIPTVEHIHNVKLPASEGAVYLELEHHLQALDMQARKETKFKNVSQGDRNARLEEALADSRTAEEALLKRCCHFTLDLTDKKRDVKSAREACEHIAGARRDQLNGCEEDLRKTINSAVALHTWIRKKGALGPKDTDPHPFRDWVRSSFDEKRHEGDDDAAQRLKQILGTCGFQSCTIPDSPIDGKPAKVDAKAQIEDVKWELREQTHLLRRLSKELVARIRSLRFFDVIRKLQRNGDEAVEVLEASTCGHRPSNNPTVEMAVLSCCGHVSCLSCMENACAEQRCVKGYGCDAAVRHTNIVKVSSLGIEGELSSGRFGAKLQRLVDLIKSIPRKERILVFLQWEDLAGKVSEALTAGNIKHVNLSGSVKSRANTLDRFQSSDSETARVLLLKMNDASAAGSNLTTANHAIFLGPLLTNSLLNYRAVETQAIGRIRRYGQSRKVHIHRILALDTIDKTIFESRTAELRAKVDYVEIPVERYMPAQQTTRKGEREGEV